MRELAQQAPLALERAPRLAVARVIRAQRLRHAAARALLAPDVVDVVRAGAVQMLDDRVSGDELGHAASTSGSSERA